MIRGYFGSILYVVFGTWTSIGLQVEFSSPCGGLTVTFLGKWGKVPVTDSSAKDLFTKGIL